MKTIVTTSSGLAALAIVLAVGANSARGDETAAPFYVLNNLHQVVGVWVASEKNTSPNPWAYIELDPGREATFTLQSPDRYVVALDVGKQRSRSKPVALSAFMAAHLDYVLVVAPEQSTGYRLEFVPTKAGAAPPKENFFDFKSEKTDSDKKGP